MKVTKKLSSLILSGGLICLLFFISTSYLWSEDTVRKLMIPYPQITGAAVPSESSLQESAEILFRNTYQFLSYLPLATLPDEQVLRNTKITDPASLLNMYSADYMIQLIIQPETSADQSRIQIQLSIWSNKKTDKIFEKKYSATTDLEIYDAIDRIIPDIILSVFGITPRFAQFSFGDFIPGQDRYTLYLNNRQVDKIDSREYNRTLKVLAGYNYNVMLIRERDQVIVYNQNFYLKENSIQSVSYQGQAAIHIGKLKGTDKNQTYLMILDGKLTEPGTDHKNLQLDQDHRLLVTTLNNKILLDRLISLRDGDFLHIDPDVLAPRFQPGIFILGGSLAGIGMDYKLNRRITAGMEWGYGFIMQQNLQSRLYFTTLRLTADFLLFQFPDHAWRYSLGAGIGPYFSWPASIWNQVTDLSSWAMVYQIWFQIRWKGIYLRLGAALDFQQSLEALPLVSIGYKL